jgi:hypothetical protein
MFHWMHECLCATCTSILLLSIFIFVSMLPRRKRLSNECSVLRRGCESPESLRYSLFGPRLTEGLKPTTIFHCATILDNRVSPFPILSPPDHQLLCLSAYRVGAVHPGPKVCLANRSQLCRNLDDYLHHIV